MINRVPMSVPGTFDVYVRSAGPATLRFDQGDILPVATSDLFEEIGQVKLNGADNYFYIELFGNTGDQPVIEEKGDWVIGGCQETFMEVQDNRSIYFELIKPYKINFEDNCTAAYVLPSSPGEEYFLDIDYKYNRGSPPRLIVSHIGNGVSLFPSQPLLQHSANSDVWQNYNSIVKSRVNDDWISFGFVADPPIFRGEETCSQYQVRLTRLPKVEVVFGSIQPASRRNTPKLSDTQISPIEYEVTVQDASEPFLLVLSESFDPGWKAFVDSGNQVDESNHIQVNYYANGWWIDRTGDFNITIRHSSQDYVLAGLIVSIIVSVIAVSYMVIIRRGDQAN